MKKNMNRVTGICLGVIDMKKSLQFYRDKLGFKTDETGDNPDMVFFCTPGTKLELYPLDLLAKDIDPGNPPAPGSGFGGITLAYNAITKEEVVEISKGLPGQHHLPAGDARTDEPHRVAVAWPPEITMPLGTSGLE